MALADNGPYVVDEKQTAAVRALEKSMGRNYFGPVTGRHARELLPEAYRRRDALNKAIADVEAMLDLQKSSV